MKYATSYLYQPNVITDFNMADMYLLVAFCSVMAVVSLLLMSYMNRRNKRTLERMKQLERDIHSERLKLMHERVELERRYHMYM